MNPVPELEEAIKELRDELSQKNQLIEDFERDSEILKELYKNGIIDLNENYIIRRYPVPPVSFGKSWSLTISLKKNYIENFRIKNYFKKIFFNFSFHYVRYCNHLVTFFENFSHQFVFFQALNEVSQSNIFLVFFC